MALPSSGSAIPAGSCFSRLNREDAERYLEDRRSKGFNVIQVMLLHTLGVVNAYGDSALISRDPSKPKTTPGNAFSDTPAIRLLGSC